MKQIATELVPFDIAEWSSNAFSLMGAWRAAAQEIGTSSQEIEDVLRECKLRDYNHLVATLVANSITDDE